MPPKSLFVRLTFFGHGEQQSGARLAADLEHDPQAAANHTPACQLL